jgi:hypothetical protein
MDASLRNRLRILYPVPFIFGTAGATPFSLVKRADVLIGSVQGEYLLGQFHNAG